MRTLFLIGLTTFLLLLFGCSAQQPTQAQPASTPSAPSSVHPEVQSPPSSGADCSTGTLLEQEKCYYELAASKKEASYCDKITQEFIQGSTVYNRNTCYGEVAAVLKDPSICVRGNVNNSFHGARACYSKVAVAEGDYSVCAVLGDLDNAACITNVAVSLKDESICDKMSIDSLLRKQDTCITNIAVIKQDISICQKVSHDDWKKLCLSQVPKGKDAVIGLCDDLTYIPTLRLQYCRN